MNKALRRLSLAVLVLFVVMLINVNYLQVFRASSLAAEPANPRILAEQSSYQRGEIIAAGGPGPQQVIAASRPAKGGGFQRYYPAPQVYAPVTGYDTVDGTFSGIELAENSLLSGTAPSLAVHNLIGLLTGKSKQGASVYLTISPRAQTAAYQALQAMGRPAAAVAIDPSTGAILALASYPTFNPNLYATPSSSQLAKIDSKYRNDPSQPLLNRAIDTTFPPGSTFKIVTGSAAYSIGHVSTPNSPIPAPQFYRLPGSTHVLTNDGNAPCGNGKPPIAFAFAESCNTAFGKLGATIGSPAIHKYANLFGFNNPNLTIPLPVAQSNYPLLTDPAETAMSAIGQFSDTVTPLQEAMMAAVVANGGVLMQPHLVQEIRAPDLSVLSTTAPTVLRRVTSAQVAHNMGVLMEGVTHDPYGTAYLSAGPSVTGINIAGKTGTAQNGVNNSGLDDAVFTCFAPYSNPKIAVGVIVKGGGYGADAAAPIAVKIIQAYLGRH
ncbi:MAG: peptidoglycan D,D-transpeptidase FtsI family protein [Streptosporangiaceae bacterium]